MITTRTRFARIGGVALITIATLGLVPWKLAAQDADAEVVAKLKEENAQLRKQLEAMRRDAEKMRADEEQLRNPATAERQREAALRRETAERNAQLARNHERQQRDIEAIRVEQLRLVADQQRRTEELQARLQALRKQFTDNNPLVRQTQAQLEVMEAMGTALTRAQANGYFFDPLEANKEAAAANERAMKRQDQQKQQRTQEQQEQQRALLQKEIELAERHVEYVRKELENGKTIPTALLTAQRELLEVRLQLARLSNSNADQRAVLLQQLNAAEHMLKENKKRIEVGTMSPGAEIPFEREVLRIKRQLHEFEDSDVRE